MYFLADSKDYQAFPSFRRFPSFPSFRRNRLSSQTTSSGSQTDSNGNKQPTSGSISLRGGGSGKCRFGKCESSTW